MGLGRARHGEGTESWGHGVRARRPLPWRSPRMRECGKRVMHCECLLDVEDIRKWVPLALRVWGGEHKPSLEGMWHGECVRVGSGWGLHYCSQAMRGCCLKCRSQQCRTACTEGPNRFGPLRCDHGSGC